MSIAVWIAFAATWIVLGVVVVLLAGCLRFMNGLQERIQESIPHITGMELGEQLKHFRLPALHGGEEIDSESLLGTGRSTILLLLTATCGECEAISRQIAELARRPGGIPALGWSIVLAWYGDRKLVIEKAQVLPEDAPGLVMLLDETGWVARDFLVASLPVGLAIDAEGRVTAQSANPGPNWLYRTLGSPPPEQPLPTSWIATIEARA